MRLRFAAFWMVFALWVPLALTNIAPGQSPGPKVGGDVSPDSAQAVLIPFPVELRRENISSRGQGCCVFRSIHHASLWQSVPQLTDFPEWLQRKGLAGGGYPGNVIERITAICRERSLPEPRYVQATGGANLIEILKLATKTGRLPGATYSYSPTGRYNGQRIAHMVNPVHVTDQWVAILDNNYIGQLEWIPTRQYLPVLAGRSGNDGWVVVLLNPGPPPAFKS